MELVSVKSPWCKGCGICVAFCPKKCLSLVDEKAVYAPENCIACGMCALYCPDLAITVDKSLKAAKQKSEVA